MLSPIFHLLISISFATTVWSCFVQPFGMQWLIPNFVQALLINNSYALKREFNGGSLFSGRYGLKEMGGHFILQLPWNWSLLRGLSH